MKSVQLSRKSPFEKEQYDRGVELAYESDQALTRAKMLGEVVARLSKISETQQVSQDDINNAAHAEAEARQHFDTTSKFAARFLERGTPTEHQQIIDNLDSQLPEFWGLLSREQQAFADESKLELMKKFGLKESEIGLVMAEEEDGSKTVAVMHVGQTGIKYDSWDSVMSDKTTGIQKVGKGSIAHRNDENFRILIGERYVEDGQGRKVGKGGKWVDTRSGMTASLYEAFLKQAKASGVSPLPDSNGKIKDPETGNTVGRTPQTYTMLTGERLELTAEEKSKLNPIQAEEFSERLLKFFPVASTLGGEMHIGRQIKNQRGEHLYFRPVVQIAQLPPVA